MHHAQKNMWSALQKHCCKLLSVDAKLAAVQHVVPSQPLHGRLIIHGKTEENTTEIQLMSLGLNMITFDSPGKLTFCA